MLALICFAARVPWLQEFDRPKVHSIDVVTPAVTFLNKKPTNLGVDALDALCYHLIYPLGICTTLPLFHSQHLVTSLNTVDIH